MISLGRKNQRQVFEGKVLVTSGHSPGLQQFAQEGPACRCLPLGILLAFGFVFPCPMCLLWQHRGAGTEDETHQQAPALYGVKMQVFHFMHVHDSAAASELTTAREALDPTERSCVSLGGSAVKVKPQELSTENLCLAHSALSVREN